MPDAHDARNLDENAVIVQSSFKINLQTRILNKYFDFVENEIVE